MSDDPKIARVKLEEFLVHMPAIEALIMRYVEALQAIATEGDDGPNNMVLTPKGHLNCRLIAKKALEP